MDESTRALIENFIQFLAKTWHERKESRPIQINKWSLVGNKLTVEVFIKEIRKDLFFDIREIKENQNRFDHLLTSASDQLSALLE